VLWNSRSGIRAISRPPTVLVFLVLSPFAQPLLVHIDPDRVLIVACRQFAQVKSNSVERLVDAAVVPDVSRTPWITRITCSLLLLLIRAH